MEDIDVIIRRLGAEVVSKKTPISDAVVPLSNDIELTLAMRIGRTEEHAPDFYNDGTVKLHVSGLEEPFKVHRNLLCDVSATFREAIYGSYRPLTKSSLAIEAQPTIVNAFLQWLYRGRFPLWCDDEQDFILLARLGVFAERYRIPDLAEVIIDTLLALSHLNIWFDTDGGTEGHIPNQEVINFVYANTEPDSQLRKILVAWHLYHPMTSEGNESHSLKALILKCPGFGADVVEILAHQNASKRSRCYIHRRAGPRYVPNNKLNWEFMSHVGPHSFPKSNMPWPKDLGPDEKYEIFYGCCGRRHTRDKTSFFCGVVETACSVTGFSHNSESIGAEKRRKGREDGHGEDTRTGF